MAPVEIIRIENLSKRFGEKIVLDNISLSVMKGENLVVFGQSGTGKSVLLKCIIGLLEPDEGAVFIKDQNVIGMSQKKLNQIRRSTSFLFQGAALYDSMTVRENLEFPLKRQFEISDDDAYNKVVKTLEMVSLAEAINKMPSELSGGMKKRVGLARSIITDPEIMFYDEPTTGLDPISSKEISELILDLQRKLKMTSIIVTHDLNCAHIISDRNIFIKDGKIAYQGTIEELANSNDKFLKNFFSNQIIH